MKNPLEHPTSNHSETFFEVFCQTDSAPRGGLGRPMARWGELPRAPRHAAQGRHAARWPGTGRGGVVSVGCLWSSFCGKSSVSSVYFQQMAEFRWKVCVWLIFDRWHRHRRREGVREWWCFAWRSLLLAPAWRHFGEPAKTTKALYPCISLALGGHFYPTIFGYRGPKDSFMWLKNDFSDLFGGWLRRPAYGFVYFKG